MASFPPVDLDYSLLSQEEEREEREFQLANLRAIQNKLQRELRVKEAKEKKMRDLAEQISYYTPSLSTNQEKLQQLDGSIDDITSRLFDLKEKVRAAQENFDELFDATVELINQKTDREKNRVETQYTIARLEKELDRLRQELARVEADQ